jgi:hypothetical protein
MEMLNPHCGVDRDPRGVVRLTICNAGSLNILSSAVTDGVREGFEKLAGDRTIRAVILAGQSEKSMIGGADIKEMAHLNQKSAEAFITRLRDLCEAIRNLRRLSRGCPAGASAPGWKSPPAIFRIAGHDAKFGMPGQGRHPSVTRAPAAPDRLAPAGWCWR